MSERSFLPISTVWTCKDLWIVLLHTHSVVRNVLLKWIIRSFVPQIEYVYKNYCFILQQLWILYEHYLPIFNLCMNFLCEAAKWFIYCWFEISEYVNTIPGVHVQLCLCCQKLKSPFRLGRMCQKWMAVRNQSVSYSILKDRWCIAVIPEEVEFPCFAYTWRVTWGKHSKVLVDVFTKLCIALQRKLHLTWVCEVS